MSSGARCATVALAFVALVWCGATAAQEEMSAWDEYTEAGYTEVQRGDLDKAADLFSLAFKETEGLSTKDPRYATSLANLAWVYSLQKRFAEAKVLYREAYAARRQTLGPAHRATLESQEGFAEMLQRLGEYELAEDVFRKVLEVREQTLGTDHPDLVVSLENLARLYRDQERYAEAQPLLERALALREAAGGAGDPKVQALLEGLSELHERQGNLEEAVGLFRRALELTERYLGDPHPFVAGMLERYAELLRKAGKDEEADRAEARAFDIRAQTEHMGPPEPGPQP